MVDFRERTETAPILVVEDNPAVCEVIADLLLDEGYRVVVARAGVEALEATLHHRPSLLILDVLLPDSDAEGVLAGLRSAYGDIPILLTSALPVGPEEVRQVGAYAFLRKPFAADDLLDEVRWGLLGTLVG